MLSLLKNRLWLQSRGRYLVVATLAVAVYGAIQAMRLERSGRISDSWQAAWAVQPDLLTVLVPLTVMLAFGRDNDARAPIDLHCSGIARGQYTVSVLASSAIICAGLTGLQTIVSFTVGALRQIGGDTRSPIGASHESVARDALMAVVTIVLCTIIFGAVGRWSSTMTAVLMVGAVYLADLAVTFTAYQGVQGVIGTFVPSQALQTIQDGRVSESISSNRNNPFGILAVTVLMCYSVLALMALYRGSLPVPSVERKQRARLPRTVSIAVIVGIPLVIGAIVPTALTRWLPWNLRPSHLIEEATGTGPDQVALDFLHRLWAVGNYDPAELTASGALDRTLGSNQVAVQQRMTEVHTITYIVTATHATVRINGVHTDGSPGAFYACMVRRGSSWRISRMGGSTQCH